MCPTLYGFIPQTFCGDEVASLCAERTGAEDIQGDGDPLLMVMGLGAPMLAWRPELCALLAERDHVAYDQEMLFVGATLHDLGLTTKYATPEHSFEMDGADAAKAFLVSEAIPAASQLVEGLQ